MSNKGIIRKDRILERIFYQREQTALELGFYQASRFQLKRFMEKFQKKEPLIHFSHVEEVKLVKDFLVKFVPVSQFKALSADSLNELSLDAVELKAKDTMFIGKDASEYMKKCSYDVKEEFF